MGWKGVSDEQWAKIRKHVPARPERPHGGRCRYYPRLTQGYYPEIDPPPTLAEGRIANGIVVVI